MPRCRLCLADACSPAGKSQGRTLIHCGTCGLVFVPEAEWVTVDEERDRYAFHDNHAANQGYVAFLAQVADVVCGLTAPDAAVLDFGSGENHVLTDLLNKRGRRCRAYDPLYGVGGEALRVRYDVIVMCEVIEHLRDLRGELARLGSCLGFGGQMVVRTQCYPSLAELPSWWYTRDVTHINFFSASALSHAARLAGLGRQASALPDIFVWGAI